MEDLSSITKALSEAVNNPDEGFVSTVNEYLRSDNAATRRAVVETLVELLDGTSEESKAKQELVFKETALIFIPSLLPVLVDAPLPVKQLFEIIAFTARPKEVVLALNEGLQIVEERIEQLQWTDISDDEQEEDLTYEGTKYQDLVQGILGMIIKTYAQVIPRMGSPKSTPTILTMSEAVSSALAGLAQSTPTPLARVILRSTCELVGNCWTWAQTSSDKGGEQKTILFNLLCMAIARYTPPVDAHMFEKWFLDQHPKYAGLHDEVVDMSGIEVLEHSRRTLESLGYGQTELESLLNPRNGSPFATLASITILARYEMTMSSTTHSLPLADQMPALSAALSGSAIDAGLLKIFSFLERGGVPDHDQATLLVELVMPLAAFPTAPTTQTALLKLIEAIVNSQPSPDKTLILKQLLEPQNPFDSIRTRSISILRSQLSSNLPLIQEAMAQLIPIVYTIPTAPPVLEMGLQELKGTMYPAWFTECANLLWFVLDLDHDGSAGIKQKETVGRIDELWLRPVRGYYEKIKAESEAASSQEDGEGTFILQMWGDALARAQQSVNDVLGQA